MSGGSQSGYGSNPMTQPRQTGYRPQSQNPQFLTGMDYGESRARMMPGYNPRPPGQYGSMGPILQNIPIPPQPPQNPHSGGGATDIRIPPNEQFNTRPTQYFAQDPAQNAQLMNQRAPDYFSGQPQAQGPMNSQGLPLMNAGLLQQLFGNRY
jgi:hypothetical protein